MGCGFCWATIVEVSRDFVLAPVGGGLGGGAAVPIEGVQIGPAFDQEPDDVEVR